MTDSDNQLVRKNMNVNEYERLSNIHVTLDKNKSKGTVQCVL